MEKDFNPKEFPVGIVGLGLMGSSIAACMLMAGHPVVGIELVEGALEMGDNRIRKHFILARERGLIDK
ncbi:MAG: 3-hydroxyacyl-CoA dehydrogenase NAD-binding domain-containing protein, partial [Cyclobacteriaceae bacterium]